MFRKTFRTILLCMFCLPLFSAAPAHAKSFDLDAFSKIPVMHEGRIKPMDSVARSLHKKLSGNDKQAILWLAEALFNPALAENTPVLKIINPNLLNMLELEHHETKLYAYNETSSALAKKQDILRSILETPEDKWTPAQRDFVALQQNTVLLANILSSLTLFLPLSVQLPDDVPAPLQPYAGKQLSYLDVSSFQGALQTQVKAILATKGNTIEDYTPAEQAIIYLSFTAANLKNAGQNSKLLKVFPSSADNIWQTPWQNALKAGAETNAQPPATFADWQALAFAFHNNDAPLWQSSITHIEQEIRAQAGGAIRENALETEYLYNHVNPFYISMLLYAFSLLIVAVGLYWKKETITRIALLPLWGGAILHLAGIAARIYILERPPVSTLYESIIFVGIVTVLYGLLAFMRDKSSFWLLIAAGGGFILHLLGVTFDESGDNLMVLTAVLNTNFWLATHVICITMGYAFCLITSILAHYALIRAAMGKYNDALFKHIYNVALLALLFSAVGTVLGGIWADQSWGRFWGWDPKENGALLIVLWLIWILHGRISGQLQKPMVIAGLAYLSVIVSLSWFGVNLLSVGLHAYGFTDSAAWMLASFIGGETALIIGLCWFIQKQSPKTA